MNISNFKLPNNELKLVLHSFHDEYGNNPIVYTTVFGFSTTERPGFITSILIETIVLTTKNGEAEKVLISSDLNVLDLYTALYGCFEGMYTLNEIAGKEATKKGIEVQRKYLQHQEEMNSLSFEQSAAYHSWIQEETNEFLSELTQDSTDLNPLFTSKFVGEAVCMGIKDLLLNRTNLN